MIRNKVMSDLEKLESDKYLLVPKFRVYVKDISLFLMIGTFFVFLVRKNDLTFDDIEQKANVLEHTKNVSTNEVKIISERQSVIQRDIEEIKTLLRKLEEREHN